jgi:hypothetical protein
LIKESENELNAFRDPSTINSDARISFTTYIYDKNSFKILLGSKDTLVELLHDCPKMISPGTEEEITYISLQHTRRLSNLGHILAKLGDFLLPVVKTENISADQALGCFHFVNNDNNNKFNQILEAILAYAILRMKYFKFVYKGNNTSL